MSRKKLTEGLEALPNGSYRRAEYINGKRRYFTAKEPAEVWKRVNEAKRNAIKEEERAKQEVELGPLFSEVAEGYRRDVLEGLKYGTKKSYVSCLRRAVDYFGDYRMKEIQTYMVSKFLKSMKGYATSTVKNQKTVISAIWTYWLETESLHGDFNPIHEAKVPTGLKKTKRKPPTAEQVKIVREHWMDEDDILPLAFLCTGERKGELCAITIGDINFDKDLIYITKSVEHIGNQPKLRDYTKTEAGIRTIPLLSLLKKALWPYRHRPKGTYIIGMTSQPVTRRKYDTMWAGFWRKYGYAEAVLRQKKWTRADGKTVRQNYYEWKATVTGHQFRHEYVCMLVEAGVSIEVAIHLVGHADAEMIRQVYMDLKPSMIEDAKAKLNGLLAG